MVQVPRYTSYPTAPNFHEGINGEVYKSWLSNLSEENNLSLYFHIPFCRQLCWFCGCQTKIVNGYDPVEYYLKLLIREVKLVASYTKRRTVNHIHFGGGSPTILNGNDFKDFMDLVSEKFIILKDAEIAIEIDPRTVDTQKIKMYSQAQVNRASLGVQDFDHQVQRAINRIQSFSLVEAVIKNLRDAAISDINIDLVYGLPHQTVATLTNTIEQTLSLGPNRISLFGYAHVPWMKKHQNLIPEQSLPNKQLRMELFDQASNQLVNAGYIAIGLDHFVKPDDGLARAKTNQELNRNFQGYTTDTSDTLLGLGISSISTLPKAYIQNTSDYQKYSSDINKGVLPVARGIKLNNQDIDRRNIIMSLMCNRSAMVHVDNFKEELDRLKDYIKNNDITYKDGKLEVSPQARHQLRIIASAFDQYMQVKSHQYSQAV